MLNKSIKMSQFDEESTSSIINNNDEIINDADKQAEEQPKAKRNRKDQRLNFNCKNTIEAEKVRI